MGPEHRRRGRDETPAWSTDFSRQAEGRKEGLGTGLEPGCLLTTMLGTAEMGQAWDGRGLIMGTWSGK